jgi:hypothetical protein
MNNRPFFLTQLVLRILVLFLFVTGIFLVPKEIYADQAPGCTSDFQYCLLAGPDNWATGECIQPPESGGLHACTLGNGNLGAACCNKQSPDSGGVIHDKINKICGSGQNSNSCQLVCRTSSGDVSQNWNWCGNALLGNACCTTDTSSVGLNFSDTCSAFSQTFTPSPPATNNCNNPSLTLTIVPFNLCQSAGASGQGTACMDCAQNNGVWTAVGCVPTSRTGIVSSFLTLAIGLSGGVILLRLLQASFMLSTSQGEPNKVKEAQEIFTSSFAGLLFVLFSIVILNTIGVNILQIPGF